MTDIDGDLDLEDIDTDQPVPSDWSPQQDELPFNAQDKNEAPND
jgi:hypothetical protein